MRTILVVFAILFAAPAFAQSSCKPDARTRHVILMIADGVGFNAWMAADYHQHGATGRQAYQQMRPGGHAPVVLGVATQQLRRNGDGRDGVADPGYDPATRWRSPFTTGSTGSAEASTAMHAGRKTLDARINVDADGVHLITIAHRAEHAGLATGIVTSVQASHATPAGAWARVNHRNRYADIFAQLTDGGLDVVFGAGHPLYDDAGGVRDPAALKPEHYHYVGGLDVWTQLTGDRGRNGYAFIETRAQFEALARGEGLPRRVVGIARVHQTLQARRPAGATVNEHAPSLAVMTDAALKVLGQDPDGFFVMIEGGAQDWVNHDNNLARFLEEQRDFDAAAAAAVAWVETHSNWCESLLIVTADHETGGLWGARTWTDRDGDRRFDGSKGDVFHAHHAPRRTRAGACPDVVYQTGGHSGELVPLWVLGRTQALSSLATRTDPMAAALWGEAYRWDGRFIDNTMIFEIMRQALPEGR